MSDTKIKPIAGTMNRIIVVPDPIDTVTAGGIFIPDGIGEPSRKGTIYAVGDDLKDTPPIVKVGDSVIYGKYAGTEILIDGQLYFIMRESDVYAVLNHN